MLSCLDELNYSCTVVNTQIKLLAGKRKRYQDQLKQMKQKVGGSKAALEQRFRTAQVDGELQLVEQQGWLAGECQQVVKKDELEAFNDGISF